MILISAGHYPRKPGGGCNPALDINEHRECVGIVDCIEAEIKRDSRFDYKRVPIGTLSSKVKWINQQQDVDISVEVHLNAFNGEADYGCSLYLSEKGKRAAGFINEYMQRYLPFRKFHKMPMERPLAFLKDTRPVSVIVEPLFADNGTMARYLLHPRSHDIIGRAIYLGIKKYLLLT